MIQDLTEPSRRQFLITTAMAGVALPVLSQAAVERAKPDPVPQWLDTVKTAEVPDGGFEDRYEKAHGFILSRDKELVLALDKSCTHKHCPVHISKRKGELICHCHGSRYDLQGNVLKRPARLPLLRHSLRLNADGVIQVYTGAASVQGTPGTELRVPASTTQP